MPIPNYKLEIQNAMRREKWTLQGPNRVVKVVKLLPGGVNPIGGNAGPSKQGGYITTASSLRNMMPAQIEKALGLPAGELGSGAVIYKFLRLPQPSEVTYELTADHPGGQKFTSMSHPSYPPGSAQIHQWRIDPPHDVPVDTKNPIVLMPGQKFPG